MKSLIVIDDLMELLPSRNRFIRNGTSWYAGHLARQTEKTIRRLKREGNYPVGVAGPKAVLDQISSEVEKFDYSFWFDTIEFAHGGKISAQLADPFEQSRHVQSACPDLFVGKVSIPKIASIRFRISICYNAVNNYLLLQNIITKNSISSVVVISGTSEIEKIALAIAKRDNLAVKVARPHNLRCVIKAYFSNYVYFRDRKLHARASLSRARVDSEPILPTQKKLICLAPAHSLHFRMLMPLAQMLNRSENYEAVVLLEDTMSAYGLKLKELGIRFYSLAGESKKRLYDELNKQVKNLVKAWDQLTRIQDFKREFESEGVDWFSILKDKWRWYFRFSYAETCVMKKRIMNVLRATKPAAVITVSDSRFLTPEALLLPKSSKYRRFFILKRIFTTPIRSMNTKLPIMF